MYCIWPGAGWPLYGWVCWPPAECIYNNGQEPGGTGLSGSAGHQPVYMIMPRSRVAPVCLGLLATGLAIACSVTVWVFWLRQANNKQKRLTIALS